MDEPSSFARACLLEACVGEVQGEDRSTTSGDATRLDIRLIEGSTTRVNIRRVTIHMPISINMRGHIFF